MVSLSAGTTVYVTICPIACQFLSAITNRKRGIIRAVAALIPLAPPAKSKFPWRSTLPYDQWRCQTGCVVYASVSVAPGSA